MPAHYSHLTIDDRIELEKLNDEGLSQAEIARRLGVHRSTISRELRRGSWQPEHDHANLRPYLRNRLDTRGPHGRLYLAGQADLQARTRKARSHQPHRMRHDRLVDWVIKRIHKSWSPERISGRLTVEFPDDMRMRVCPETLYAWMYHPEQKHRELSQYLRRGHIRRRRRPGRKVRRCTILWRTPIHDRPAEIEDRQQFGHWEADSILGARGTGAIHTTVERTSRFLIAAKLPNLTATATVQAQQAIFSALPPGAARSVTTDNGSEFAHHYHLADTLAIPTYFADPYSAFQRGTNEHYNGHIRRYLPKGTNFDTVTSDELTEYVTEINNLPCKALAWATPAEIFHELAWNPTPTTNRCTSN